jgi:hypothetical protein
MTTGLQETFGAFVAFLFVGCLDVTTKFDSGIFSFVKFAAVHIVASSNAPEIGIWA